MSDKFSGAETILEWNASNPPGTRVVLTREDGATALSRTRSTAWMLGADGKSSGHTPVILLEGIEGPWRLSRCRPMIDKSSPGAVALNAPPTPAPSGQISPHPEGPQFGGLSDPPTATSCDSLTLGSTNAAVSGEGR